jgi:hypothetical protein
LGELRAIDIGKGWRVANVDFERFLKSRETAPREKDRTEASTKADEHG